MDPWANSRQLVIPFLSAYLGTPLGKEQGGTRGPLTFAENRVVIAGVQKLVLDISNLARVCSQPALTAQITQVAQPLYNARAPVVTSYDEPAPPEGDEGTARLGLVSEPAPDGAGQPSAADRYMMESFGMTLSTLTQASYVRGVNREDPVLQCICRVLCDFLRCLTEQVCADGRWDWDVDWATVLRDCAGTAMCSLVTCLPTAICPPDDCHPTPSCEPDPIPCDFAVERYRR